MSDCKCFNTFKENSMYMMRVITKLPNSEQSYKGKVKTHKYINNRKTVKTVMMG